MSDMQCIGTVGFGLRRRDLKMYHGSSFSQSAVVRNAESI